MTHTPCQILVHLDSTRAAPRRLAATRRLGQQLGGRVAALYAVTPSFVALPLSPEMGPSLAATLLEIDEQRRTTARAAFDRELAAAGPAVTWADTDAVPTPAVFARQALYADLLVLGQEDPNDEAASCVPRDFVAEVLLSCRQPAVVLPYAGDFPTIGTRVAVAWKETPEAAHALQAALPLLKQAAAVHVLAWADPGSARPAGEPLDLRRYLAVHGIEPSWHRQGDEPADLGEQLLSRACDLGADLLVMGCYGHSRAREMILGGATRTVLRTMTLPVLMAH